MIKLEHEVSINKSMYNKLDEFVDKVVYSVARETLDLSYSTIPLSNRVNSGRLRASSLAYGVQGGNKRYQIGSTTSYAKYVWVMDNDTTNWTTAGTGSEWYTRYFKEHGNSILSNAVERNKLK